MWAGWFLLCSLAAVPTVSATELYGMVGAEVDLVPNTDGSTITKIIWKHSGNLAMDWDIGNEIESFRHFKERGHLNTSTGVMTITGLMLNDSGVYTSEIIINNNNKNNNILSSIQLTVISSVPVPDVHKSCNDEMTTCTLTCTGDTKGAGPVTYTWTEDDKEMTATADPSGSIKVSKDQSSEVKAFRCKLKNPVSEETSQELDNPFTTIKKLRVPTGITVCVSLITIVLVLALIHRWKAGAWFYEKESMPWELDFWKKEPRAANESNGTTSPRHTDQSDEETPMNQDG